MRPMMDERTDLDRVTRSDNEVYSCLVAHGLGVRAVTYTKDRTRLTVHWHRSPSPEERAKADSLVRGAALSHAI